MTDDLSWLRGNIASLETVSLKDRHGEQLQTLVNRDTGLVRNDPIPSDEALAKFYAHEYRVAYKGTGVPRRRQVLRNFRRAADFVSRSRDVITASNRILDVGAGSGEFLYLLKIMGKKEIKGVEPNVAYAQFCRDVYDLDVVTADLDCASFERGSFDFIRMNHVLEHLNNPIEYLRLIKRWLAPQGIIYIEVPNIEVYCATKSKGSLFHFGHIYNFNPWTLRAVAGLAGLKEVDGIVRGSPDATGVFFVHGDPWPEEQAFNVQNGTHVLNLLRKHSARGPSVVYSKKLFKLYARLNEVVAAGLSRSYVSIGRTVARKAKLGVAPSSLE